MLLCLCALGSVQAQNAQVAQIRKLYAEAPMVSSMRISKVRNRWMRCLPPVWPTT